MKDFKNLYDSNYFANRIYNDKLRLKSFQQEKLLLERYVSLNGCVCDIGCSTGEFLSSIGWKGPRYGMEISEEAKKIASQTGVSFEKNIITEKNFFDTIIFRGTIQHLPNPFGYIEMAHKSLKENGHIIFLATPNANSLVYKIFNTLPALNPSYNFYIPSDITLRDILKNYNFQVLEINKPYINSPYSRLFSDHLNFFLSIITKRKPKFAFWGNMMNVIAKKEQ